MTEKLDVMGEEVEFKDNLKVSKWCVDEDRSFRFLPSNYAFGATCFFSSVQKAVANPSRRYSDDNSLFAFLCPPGMIGSICVSIKCVSHE